MVMDKIKNKHQQIRTSVGSSDDTECSSPSNILIYNDDNNDNDAIPKYENFGTETNKFKKPVNLTDQGFDYKNFTENKIDFGNNDEFPWKEIVESRNKRKKIFNRFKEESRFIKPKEFESYHEYFILNNFKKDKTTRGHVNVENIRSNNLQHRTRFKKQEHQIFISKPITSNDFSTSLSNKCYKGFEEGVESLTRNHQHSTKNTDDEHTGYRNRDQETRFRSSLKEESLESTSILNPNYQTGERRSQRLSNKTNNRKISSCSSTEDDIDVSSDFIIKDLYEAIVPKVEKPFRRSDWVLPSKYRYIPDKQIKTKPGFEKVNLTELISANKIQRVLTKFEGGLKGIRKTNWNSMS